MLIWLCVPLVCSAIVCPVLSCGSLGTVACTKKVSPTQLMLNDQNCAEGTVCSLLSVYNWWWDETTSSGSTHNCAVANFTFVPPTCESQPERKSLLDSTPPKNCDSDEDCALEDGSYASCACSLRTGSTRGYCKPDPGDTLFSEFWQGCSTMTAKELVYWGMYMQFYVYLQGDASCALTFEELSEFQTLHQEILEAAAFLTLAVELLL